MSNLIQFRPKLVDTLKGYGKEDLRTDLLAGLTVGVVALPLAMAFGIASGASPESGIFTAVIAGFIISAFGGSRIQIGGPTGAFIVVIFSIIAEHGFADLLVCTAMAGAMLFLMGLFRLGSMIKFIPYPVIAGFTSGIAVIIFVTQIPDFLGLSIDELPGEFLKKMAVLVQHLGTFHWQSFVLAVISLALILRWPRRWAKILPGTVGALVVATVSVVLLGVEVDTIGSRFGGIPQGLPAFAWPDFSLENLRDLLHPALVIALLGAVESLLSASVADGMIEDRHDPNQELMAQGMANLVVPFFGGIPATGAIARTATNAKNGGRTPVAGIVHALTLLGIVLIAAPLVQFIPLATLSAVLIVVALNMGEWHHFRRLAHWPRGDASVFLTVFGLTILIDITVAVEIGLLLAVVLFIKRVTETMEVTVVDHATETEGAHHSLIGKDVPQGVAVFRVFGPVFFGAVDKLETGLNRAGRKPEVLILRLRKVPALDASGITALENIHAKLRARQKHLILSGLNPKASETLRAAGFLERLGAENNCPDIDSALARARALLEESDRSRS